MRRISRRRVPAIGVVLLSLAVVVAAVVHEGMPTAEVDVNDGGVWVTSRDLMVVAHVNVGSKNLDARFRAASGTFDIGQNADVITYTDAEKKVVSVVDPAMVRMSGNTSFPEHADVLQGGDHLGVLDVAEGLLWIADASEPSAIGYDEGNAAATGLVGGVMTVGVDGVVHALAPRDGRFVNVDRTGVLNHVSVTQVPNLSGLAELSITAVGGKPVALDANANTLILPDGSQLPLSKWGLPPGAVLQDPGPAADHVLLATPSELVQVKLDGSGVTRVPAVEGGAGDGRPAAPVRLGTCEYAAWGGTAAYLRQCDDGAVERMGDIPELANARELRFRTNRNLIVLNDVRGGLLWLPDEKMVLVDSMKQMDQELKKTENQDTAPQTTTEVADPQRKQKNHPPKANPDDFGVRAGRVTTLDVLGNDSDEDGDVLTATLNKGSDRWKVAATRGGQALQIFVPEGATGSTSFTYNANDGENASDSALVNVRVVPPSVNNAPFRTHDSIVKMGQRASVNYNVLRDWRDPDGDPIFLADVSAPSGIQVHFREEGTVFITDLGHDAGPVSLDVKVSDGDKVGEGVLTVKLLPGDQPPVANGDFYVGQVNQPILVQPLANDYDPNGDQLRLQNVECDNPSVTLEPEYDSGTVTFTAKSVGSYRLVYKVAAGQQTTAGVVRVDVVDADLNAAPVAEDDLALLPAGGVALVSPLDNDSDPGGGVLVIQSIVVPDALQVALVDHHLLRVSASGQLDPDAKMVPIKYTVSNGAKKASARVMVIPTAAAAARPPEPQPDRIQVRVGDIGSVSVLENDRSPLGLPLTVSPNLKVPERELAYGKPFVTGNQVRLEATEQPGTVEVTYTVEDSAGRAASSQVVFDVVQHTETNAAPRPKALTAWAVVGQTARIPVPLSGIDPDGDSTVLIGPSDQPKMGSVRAGVDWLEYTPSGATGTDVFTYIVEDRLGKQATARVRVGITSPPELNEPPYAARDTVLVRPARTLSIPVLANDVDADGDELALVPDGLKATDPQLAPSVTGATVTVTSPAAEGSYLFTYEITDGHGGFATGPVTLNVKADAPLAPPIARDDVVTVGDLPSGGQPVLVHVLDNDEDPDGDTSKLKILCGEGGMDCNADGVEVRGNVLAITPHETRRLVVYAIQDEDGLVAKAVVWVPGTLQAAPYIDPTKVPVQMRVGQELELELSQYVIVPRPNRTARITDPAKITAAGTKAPTLGKGGASILFAPEAPGDTAISFEVSDGDAADRSALTVTLTIPIHVAASQNKPPTIVPSRVKVAAGEGAETVDLPSMVRDPDGRDPRAFVYVVKAKPVGLDVRQDGGQLRISAPASHDLGDAGDIEFTVDDGSGEVSGKVPVTVVKTTRDLIMCSDPDRIEADAAKPVTVDLADYCRNPFPDQPMRVVSPNAKGIPATVRADGTKLTVTPRAGAHGDMVIAFRMADATGLPERTISHSITIVVRDRPDPPRITNARASGAGKAVVEFTAGADNGEPITAFEVTTAGITQKCDAPTTSCEIKGLTSGAEYSFTVRALNQVGWSQPSDPASALIDMKPAKPQPPEVDPGDQSMDVRWKAPDNEGSPITGYKLLVDGGPTLDRSAGDTKATISGLTNGSSYCVRVIASNKNFDSEPSECSKSVVPFGRPSAPTDVKVAYEGPEGDGVRYTVSWSTQDMNGGKQDRVRISIPMLSAFAEVNAAETGGSKTISVPPSSGAVVVSVSVHSDRFDPDAEKGWSAVARSQSFTPRLPPVPLADVPALTPTGVTGELQITGVSRTPGNLFKAADLKLQYTDPSGNWTTLPHDCTTAHPCTVGGFKNGTEVEVQFRQFSDSTGLELYSEPVKASAVPFGPPQDPSIELSWSDGNLIVAWSADANNGGPEIADIALNGASVFAQSVKQDGKYTGSSSYAPADLFGGSNTKTFTVKVTEGGLGARTASAQATAIKGALTNRLAACPASPPASASPSATPAVCHATIWVKSTPWTPSTSLKCTYDSDLTGNKETDVIPADGTEHETAFKTDRPAKDVGANLTCLPK